VRVEDIDGAREVPGAAADILRTLEAFGLGWDGPVLYQSSRGEAYAEALGRLSALGLTYECSCSRSEFGADSAEARYPGTCRSGPKRRDVPLATRFRTLGSGRVTVMDRLQGLYTQDIEAVVGDFVLRRRDGYWSYQLAVVIDDAFQGITDVVRGSDLLDNTPRQRLLQAALGLPAPRTLHLPLLVEPAGGKLSKSRRSLPVDRTLAPRVLTDLLSLLRHPPPAELQHAPVAEQLRWAAGSWNPFVLQGVMEIISVE
jgi:glutamyl-Q tRNA(Asp) synthetase